ncbi:hypothetical protein T07_7396 [Trichinella nelsoni]|uniref:Uncharacterized protein n=1 Tax=Trichinella nelsoni TaxID=6336 RepID=A0A0V0RIP2_9BILA|nr:hypothetical protein T07_7396 [Trichinella nelsoni]
MAAANQLSQSHHQNATTTTTTTTATVFFCIHQNESRMWDLREDLESIRLQSVRSAISKQNRRENVIPRTRQWAAKRGKDC